MITSDDLIYDMIKVFNSEEYKNVYNDDNGYLNLNASRKVYAFEVSEEEVDKIVDELKKKLFLFPIEIEVKRGGKVFNVFCMLQYGFEFPRFEKQI